MPKNIPCETWSTGKIEQAIVDNENYEVLSQYKWYYDTQGVFRLNGAEKIYMHDEVVRMQRKPNRKSAQQRVKTSRSERGEK